MNDSFKRNRICPVEIWCELMNGDLKHFSQHDRKDIRDALSKLDGWKPNETSDGKAWFGKLFGRQRSAFIREGTSIETHPLPSKTDTAEKNNH